MIIRYVYLDGHPTQEDGTLRPARVKLPDDFQETLTVESLFSAIKSAHADICLPDACSQEFVLLNGIISTTRHSGFSVTSDDIEEDELLVPEEHFTQIVENLVAGCNLVVIYVTQERFQQAGASFLASSAPPADNVRTTQKRPRSPDEHESKQSPRPSPLSLKGSSYASGGERVTVFTALNKNWKSISFASDFSFLLLDHNILFVDFSLIIVDIENAMVGTSTKMVLFNHYESVPMDLFHSMLLCYHDIHEEQQKACENTLKKMAIWNSTLGRAVKPYRENCLVLPIRFESSTGLTDRATKLNLTSDVLTALGSFGDKYRAFLGNSDITESLNADNVFESIQGALSLVQRFQPASSVMVMIQGFDTPATDIWLGRLEGSQSLNTTENGICRWISSNILAPLVASPVVARVYGFSRTTGMMEEIRTPSFPIKDLTSLPSFQDLCAPPVLTGFALLGWLYGSAEKFPDREVLQARQQELLEICGTPYTSEDGVLKYGPRLRYTFLVSVLERAWANRNSATLSFQPRLTCDPTSHHYLSLDISSNIERAIAIGLSRMEPDHRDKLEDSSIHAAAPPFAVDVCRPFCYTDIAIRRLVKEGSTTSGDLYLIEGSRKDPVSNLLLGLGLLLALTDREEDGTRKVVFANKQAKQLIHEIFRIRVHTAEQTTYSRDPVKMCGRLQKFYQSLPLTMTRDLQENSFQVMFKERLDSRDKYVGHLLSIPELRLKKGTDDLRLNDALNKPTSNLYADCYEPEAGAVHEFKVANATNVYAGTIANIYPSTFQLRDFMTKKIDPIMKNEWPDANHWENGAEVDLEAELKENGGRPLYRDTLQWINLIVKFRSNNNKDCFERVDTRFRKGIGQVKEYQQLVAAGEAMIVDGKVLGGTSPEGIKWSVIESKTTGQNTVIKAYIWMLLCGTYIIHYELPSIEKAHKFHQA